MEILEKLNLFLHTHLKNMEKSKILKPKNGPCKPRKIINDEYTAPAPSTAIALYWCLMRI